MSGRKQTLFIEPKLFDFTWREKFEFNGIACPTCDGSGKVSEHGDYLGIGKENLLDCPRCGGSGKLKANIEICWNRDK